ncbi:hypothetical protein [Marinobacter alkaliphilus]|uniref:Uncharacterized protein n=1 Tax=Marinobacter alkaliphilus TaxID=254719 RepID=A0ABZ3E684_9GAMM
MSDLLRYRVTSQDGAPARFDESETGYWTPWYIAERRCNDLRAKLEQAEAQSEALRQELQNQLTAQWKVGVDYAEAFILRKQAEAVEEAVVYALRTVGNVDPFEVDIHRFANDYAQLLRQQADEAEQAGGEK